MEKYIQKTNDRLLKKHGEEGAKKIKRKYQIAGGIVLGFGMVGFIASFITFLVLFFKMQTETAFIWWLIAIPFIIFVVAGSVISRVGDKLLQDEIKTIEIKIEDEE